MQEYVLTLALGSLVAITAISFLGEKSADTFNTTARSMDGGRIAGGARQEAMRLPTIGGGAAAGGAGMPGLTTPPRGGGSN